MADSTIAVQPATSIPAAAPVQFALETIVNAVGQQALVQVITIADELGRPIYPMSENTGVQILEAIRALHVAIAVGTDQLLPSTRGFLQ